MWELMNGMAGSMRNRWMPRRHNNGMGTLTAMVLGASVGIAAWETVRRSRTNGSDMGLGNVSQIANEVMNGIDE